MAYDSLAFHGRIAPHVVCIFQLQSAFRVGMLALDLLTKRTEDRPNNKYARNPPYANDVKWILKLSLKLGRLSL